MDNMDLFHQDYRKLVSHCKQCGSTFEIVTFINTKVKKYFKDNPDFINNMQEVIQTMEIEEIDYFSEDHQSVIERDISNFKLDTPKEKYIQLKYLYHYLCYLTEDQEKFDKIIGTEKIQTLKADSLKSFTSILTAEQLQNLSQEMVKQKIIDTRDVSMFLKIMTGRDIATISAIKWLPKYTKGANVKMMFEFFKHVCEHEYSTTSTINFFKKIQACFLDFNGQEFKLQNLQSNLTRWDSEFDTKRILKKVSYKNPTFVFIQHLQENGLLKIE